MKVGASSPQVAPAAPSASASAASTPASRPTAPWWNSDAAPSRPKGLSVELLNILFDLDVGGSKGDDLIQIVSRGNVTVDGGLGDDAIFVMAQNATVRGGVGEDYLSVHAYEGGQVSVAGGTGDDGLFATGGRVTAEGGSGDDHISIHVSESGFVSGGAGDDQIDGSGKVTLDGGLGDDDIRLYGSGQAHGGEGNDIVDVSNSGAAYGGEGSDRIVVSRGSFGDGGEGDDIIDVIGAFDDGGNNSVTGGAGNDFIMVVGHANTIEGGVGDDLIWSIGTNNTIAGGLGDDSILVEAGNVVVFNKGDGHDRVAFDASGKSTIKLQGFRPDEVSVVEAEGKVFVKFAGSDESIEIAGARGNAVLAFDDGSTLDLSSRYSTQTTIITSLSEVTYRRM